MIHPLGKKLNPKYIKKIFKDACIKGIVWACFIGDRLRSLIIYDDEVIRADEYKDIFYDRLFTLIDDISELSDNETIQVTDDKNFFLYTIMQYGTKLKKFLISWHNIIFQL